MKTFKISLFIILVLLFTTACNLTSTVKSQELKICPQCNMQLPDSNINTAKIEQGSDTYYFDDAGCMILWANQNEVNFQDVQADIFSHDTHTYIDAKKAFYTINEKTPMLYGFSAYKENAQDKISFEEVRMKMLRGEHMANPKIRKQILGY